MRSRKRIDGFVLLLVGVLAGLSLVGCGADTDLPNANISSGDGQDSPTPASPVSLRANQLSNTSPAKRFVNYHPKVLIKTNQGEITVQLDAKKAPRTVENFLENYVDIEYYDETVFHYVQDDFMIIAGGYTAELQPKESRGQVLNEADNGLKNLRGTIAMARHPEARNSATSQFFFNLSDNPSLDHQDASDDEQFGYCVFGKVTDGLKVVDRIAKVDVHDADNFPSTPIEPVIIESIRRVK